MKQPAELILEDPQRRSAVPLAAQHILPIPLTDDDLERITAPTLVLVGGHSQLYDAREVAAKVTARMPNAVVEIIPKPAMTWSSGIPMNSPSRSLDSPQARDGLRILETLSAGHFLIDRSAGLADPDRFKR